MKKMVLFLSLLVFIASVHLASALELNGPKLSPIIYEPGKQIINPYLIAGTDKEVEVYLGGELVRYVRLSPIVNHQFDLIIEFPQEYIPSGSYTFSLSVREKESEVDSGVGSLLSVTKVFTVIVYAYNKFITATLLAPNVNEGATAMLQVEVQSKGYVDIDSVKADITVYNDQNLSVGKIATKEKPLKALSSLTLLAPFNTSGLSSGKYRAKALVFYDDKSLPASTQFNIGAIDVALLNYTSIVEQGFSDFTMKVRNNWGNQLRNVHANIWLNGQELLQTPTITLQPWEEGELTGIMKVDLLPGHYTGQVRLFYEQEEKEIPINIQVLAPVIPQAPASGQKGNYTFLLASLLLLLSVFIIVMAIRIVRGSKDEL